jgi:hypothetical protein
MKKLLILLAFLPAIFSCESIWDNGPTKLLKDIFEITEIDNVDDLTTATKQSNFRWIRPKGLERWHIYSILDDVQRTKLIKKIKHSALDKAKMPTKKHYDAVVVYGATTQRVKTRIQFLLKLAKQGITWDKVYLLGSTRDLATGTDSDQQIAEFLKAKNLTITEMAMMEYLWQQTVKPKLFNDVPVISIESGQRADGTRANTDDTLIDMAKNMDHAKGKNILFISDNPYICYQDAVAKRILKSYGVIIETVGDAMHAESMENVLDTVARCLTNIQ